ncbi:MAG TPA: NAD(+)/NADH kinase, partial [Chloroflexota bacterium]|nr:NAD(+)/NADH kinase [Chloroflexota bacterium]
MAELPLPMDHSAMSAPLERVVLLQHPKVPASWQMMSDLRDRIQSYGVQVVTGSVWDRAELEQMLPGADLCITLGGDGSMLRAARVAAPHGVPILGINLGKLGFLAELEPRHVAERLPAILKGQYWIEERMMLVAELQRQGKVIAVQGCLNEVVVARRHLSRVIRVETHIDGYHLTTY